MDEERIHLCFVVRERKISKMLTLTACKKNERIFYLDILRVLATFAVIAIHVSAQNWYSTDIYSYEWNMFNLFDGFGQMGGSGICNDKWGTIFRSYKIIKLEKNYIPKYSASC